MQCEDPFAGLSPGYGLAPQTPWLLPVRGGAEGAPARDLTLPLRVTGPVVLDFGRKVSGRIWLEADGPLRYLYASDPEQMTRLRAHGSDPVLCYGRMPSYIAACPAGRFAGSREAVPIHEDLASLRYLRLEPGDPGRTVTLHACRLRFSPPHVPLAGAFACDDPDLERIWHMDVYTTLLCAQNNRDALVPVPAPDSGYVLWDGCRRDREVWGGDLRVASLVWLGAYADPEPVRNALYMLWQARHIACPESGMIPGSGSTHQTFYEWTFWFLVNAWEYYLWTGDRHFLRVLMSPTGLDETLAWLKRAANADGLVEASNSWMYTFRVGGELAALALVQAAGLEALAALFAAGGRPAQAAEASALADRTHTLCVDRFYDPAAGAFRMSPAGRRVHYPLDANALAVVLGIGDAQVRAACLRFLRSPGLSTDLGKRCVWPAFDDEDGDWCIAPHLRWVHNDTIWPYPNGYAAWAWFAAGQADEAFRTLKAYHRPIIDRGHATVWEAMLLDGGLPFGPDGNTLSFCHAWGGTGAYLLQRHVLGVAPAAPGFREVAMQPPRMGALRWATGRIPTPEGPVAVELQQARGHVRGTLTLPRAVQPVAVPEGIEVRRGG